MKRLRIKNDTHLVEWEDTPEAMEEAKEFRRWHPEFKHRRIKHILQLCPEKLMCRRIKEINS